MASVSRDGGDFHARVCALRDQLQASLQLEGGGGHTLERVAEALRTAVTLEDTARFIASWRGSLSEDLRGFVRSSPALQHSAMRCLGYVYSVGITPHQLQLLFGVLHPASAASPELRNAALCAIESAAHARVMRRAAPPAFWSLPGWLYGPPRQHHRHAAAPAAGTSASHRTALMEGAGFSPIAPASVSEFGYLSFSWQHWPFPREYSLWTMVRVARFGAGGDDKSTLLRVVAGNGARLHIWLEARAVHVTVQEPAGGAAGSTSSSGSLGAGSMIGGGGSTSSSALGSGGGGSTTSGGGLDFFSKAASRALATAGAVRDRLQAAATGEKSSSSSAGGVTSACAMAEELVEGRWVALSVHQARRKGLLAGPVHELTICVNGLEVLRTTEVSFPKALASAPLAVARLGEGLEGEMGPLYLWGEGGHGGGPLSPALHAELLAAHTGDAVQILPHCLAAVGGVPVPGSDSPGALLADGLFALYHPAASTAGPAVGAQLLSVQAEAAGDENESTGDPERGAGSGGFRFSGARTAAPSSDAASGAEDDAAPSCECSDAVGSSGTSVRGFNCVAAVAGASIRDSLAAVGGMGALLPLFEHPRRAPPHLQAQQEALALQAQREQSASGALCGEINNNPIGGVAGVGVSLAASPSTGWLQPDEASFSTSAKPLPGGGGGFPTDHHSTGSRRGSSGMTIADLSSGVGESSSHRRHRAERRSVAAQVTRIAALMLHDHATNRAAAFHVSFFGLLRLGLARQLQWAPGLPDAAAAAVQAEASSAYPRFHPRCDPALIPAIVSLARAVGKEPALRADVWRTLLLDMPMYAACAFPVQALLLQTVTRAAVSKSEFFRAEVGLPCLVDSLHRWYDATIPLLTREHSQVGGGTAEATPSGDPPHSRAPASAAAAVGISRQERLLLLREFLCFLGCVMGAGPSVLPVGSWSRYPHIAERQHDHRGGAEHATTDHEFRFHGDEFEDGAALAPPAAGGAGGGRHDSGASAFFRAPLQSQGSFANPPHDVTGGTQRPVSVDSTPRHQPPSSSIQRHFYHLAAPAAVAGGGAAVPTGPVPVPIVHALRRRDVEPLLQLLAANPPRDYAAALPNSRTGAPAEIETSALAFEDGDADAGNSPPPPETAGPPEQRRRTQTVALPYEDLHIAVLSLLTAFLEFDADHVGGDSGHVLASVASASQAVAAVAAAAAPPPAPTPGHPHRHHHSSGSGDGDPSLRYRSGGEGGSAGLGDGVAAAPLDPHILLSSGVLAALPVLDASCAGGDFIALLLFGDLLHSRSVGVATASLRTLTAALRANQGRPGRWGGRGGAAFSGPSFRPVVRGSGERDRLANTLGAAMTGAVPSSDPASQLPSSHVAFPGALWARDFGVGSGFDLLYYTLRDGPPIEGPLYSALLDMVLTPDALELLVAVEVEPANEAVIAAAVPAPAPHSGTPQAGPEAAANWGGGAAPHRPSRSGDPPSSSGRPPHHHHRSHHHHRHHQPRSTSSLLQRLDPPGGPPGRSPAEEGEDAVSVGCRTTGLRALLLRGAAFASGRRSFFEDASTLASYHIQPTEGRPSAPVCAPGALNLFLRLLPHMPPSSRLQALCDLLLRARCSPEAQRTLLVYCGDWPELLVRVLLASRPSEYPPRECLRLLDGAGIASTPALLEGLFLGADAPSAALDEPPPLRNAIYAAAEELLLLLCRASMNVAGGWRAFQRLFALQPLMLGSEEEEEGQGQEGGTGEAEGEEEAGKRGSGSNGAAAATAVETGSCPPVIQQVGTAPSLLLSPRLEGGAAAPIDQDPTAIPAGDAAAVAAAAEPVMLRGFSRAQAQARGLTPLLLVGAPGDRDPGSGVPPLTLPPAPPSDGAHPAPQSSHGEAAVAFPTAGAPPASAASCSRLLPPWSRPPSSLSAPLRHGRRLLCLAVGHTLADFDAHRTRDVTRNNRDNLVHVTAIVERECTVEAGAEVQLLLRVHSSGGEAGAEAHPHAATAFFSSTSSSGSWAQEGPGAKGSLPPPQGAVAEYGGPGSRGGSRAAASAAPGEDGTTASEGSDWGSEEGEGGGTGATGQGSASEEEVVGGAGDGGGGFSLSTLGNAALSAVNKASQQQRGVFTAAALVPVRQRGQRQIFPLVSPKSKQRRNAGAHGVASPLSSNEPRGVVGVHYSSKGADDDDPGSGAAAAAAAAAPFPSLSLSSAFAFSDPPAPAAPPSSDKARIPTRQQPLRGLGTAGTVRFDGLLASFTFALWDRLLSAPNGGPGMGGKNSPRLLEARASGLPLSGSLHTMLLALSLWTVTAFPLDSSETMLALARITAPLLQPIFAAIAAASTGSGGSSSGSFNSPEAADSSSGGGGGGAGEGGGEWEEVPELGRAGVRPLDWLLLTLWSVNGYLRRVQSVVLDLQDSGGPPPVPDARSMLHGCASVAVKLLAEVVSQCPQGAAAGLAQLDRLQSFLRRFREHKAGVGGRGRVAGAAGAAPGAQVSFSDSWAWLVGDDAAALGGAADYPPGSDPDPLGAGPPPPAPRDPHSSAWVTHPGWSPLVPEAVDIASAATGAARSDIDGRLMFRTWRAALHALRFDIALLRPLRLLARARRAREEALRVRFGGGRAPRGGRAAKGAVAAAQHLTGRPPTGPEAGGGGGAPASAGPAGPSPSDRASTAPLSLVSTGLAAVQQQIAAVASSSSLSSSSSSTPSGASTAASALRRLTAQVRGGVSTVRDGVREGVRGGLATVRKGLIAGVGAVLATVFDHEGGLGLEGSGGPGGGFLDANGREVDEFGYLGGEDEDGGSDPRGTRLTPHEEAVVLRAFTSWLPLVVVSAVRGVRVFDPPWYDDSWRRFASGGPAVTVRLAGGSELLRSSLGARRADTARCSHAALASLYRCSLMPHGGAWEGPWTHGVGAPPAPPLRLSRFEDAKRRRARLCPVWEGAPDFRGAAHRSGGDRDHWAAPARPPAPVLSTSRDANHGPIAAASNGGGALLSPPPTAAATAPSGAVVAAAGAAGSGGSAPLPPQPEAAAAAAPATAASLPGSSRAAAGSLDDEEDGAVDVPAEEGEADARGAFLRSLLGGGDPSNGGGTRGVGDDSSDLQSSAQHRALLTSVAAAVAQAAASARLGRGAAPTQEEEEEGEEDGPLAADPFAALAAGGMVGAAAAAAPGSESPDPVASRSGTPLPPAPAPSSAPPGQVVSSPPPLPQGPSPSRAPASQLPGSEGSTSSAAAFSLLPGEAACFDVSARLVTPCATVPGRLRITPAHVIFDPFPSVAPAAGGGGSHPQGPVLAASSSRQRSSGGGGGGPSRPARGSQPRGYGAPRDPAPRSTAAHAPQRWALRLLYRVLPRRYLQQPCALELFFAQGGGAVFLVLTRSSLRGALDALWAPRPPRLLANSGSCPRSLQPKKHLTASRVTDAWQRRALSNFDYLMALNTLAGRSFNDLTQYPVMPWVIADYSSPTLDLSNPASFRDLSRPVGALDPSRLEVFRTRMEGLAPPPGSSPSPGDIPPFLYGSHYSSAGVALFFLLRLEPFTSLALELQGGRFDVADRLFGSVAEVWRGVTRSMSDVKELIPEWYTTPELFSNASGRLPLGTRQDGTVVGDVTLPPWARTPQELVWLNRAALESEHVSAHLHEWIDLIFGFKQRGAAAVAADNVFYYLTYEDAVELDAIKDPIMRASTEAQILHFGQTPGQLFRKPHPPRGPLDDLAAPLFGFDVSPDVSAPGVGAAGGADGSWARVASHKVAEVGGAAAASPPHHHPPPSPAPAAATPTRPSANSPGTGLGDVDPEGRPTSRPTILSSPIPMSLSAFAGEEAEGGPGAGGPHQGAGGPHQQAGAGDTGTEGLMGGGAAAPTPGVVEWSPGVNGAPGAVTTKQQQGLPVDESAPAASGVPATAAKEEDDDEAFSGWDELARVNADAPAPAAAAPCGPDAATTSSGSGDGAAGAPHTLTTANASPPALGPPQPPAPPLYTPPAPREQPSLVPDLQSIWRAPRVTVFTAARHPTAAQATSSPAAAGGAAVSIADPTFFAPQESGAPPSTYPQGPSLQSAAAAAAQAAAALSCIPAPLQPVPLNSALAWVPGDQRVVLLALCGNRLLTVYGDCGLALHKCALASLADTGLPFEIRTEKPRQLLGSALFAALRPLPLQSLLAHSSSSLASARAPGPGTGDGPVPSGQGLLPPNGLGARSSAPLPALARALQAGECSAAAAIPPLLSPLPSGGSSGSGALDSRGTAPSPLPSPQSGPASDGKACTPDPWGPLPSLSVPSCFAVAFPLEGGGGSGRAGIGGSITGSLGLGGMSGGSGTSSSAAAADALLFSCGFIDGALRWSGVSTSSSSSSSSSKASGRSSDLWSVRTSGACAGDVTTVASGFQGALQSQSSTSMGLLPSEEEGAPGQVDTNRLARSSLVTGHASGLTVLWVVCRGSAPTDLAAAGDLVVGPWRGSRRSALWGREAPSAPPGGSSAPGGTTLLPPMADADAAGSGAPGSGSRNPSSQHPLPPVPGEATDTTLVCLAALDGHRTPVLCASYSAESCVVASGALDGRVMTWCSVTGRRLRVLSAPWGGGIPPTPRALETRGSLAIPAHVRLLSNGSTLVHWALHGGGWAPGRQYPLAATSLLVSFDINGAVTGSVGPVHHQAGGGPASPDRHHPTAAAAAAAAAAIVGTPGSNAGGPGTFALASAAAAAPPRITALTATRDGSTVIVGRADGTVELRHGLTLLLGGAFRVHREVGEGASPQGSDTPAGRLNNPFGGPAAPSAAGSHPQPPGGAPSPQQQDAAPSAGHPHGAGSAGTHHLAVATTGRSVVGTPLGRLPRPAAAVTALLLLDGERQLLAGCGDGRLCVAVDIEASKQALQRTLQQGLFSISMV